MALSSPETHDKLGSRTHPRVVGRGATASSPALTTAIQAVIAVSIALIAIVCFAIQYPPLLDYPNHIARLWLLDGGVKLPPFNTIYTVQWNTLTNIGIDVLSLPLSHIMSNAVLAKVFLILAVCLPPLGAIALHRRIFGGVHWWQIGLLVIAWNSMVLAGFLNFEIGLGLALLGAAADERLKRLGLIAAAAIRFILALILLVVHPFAGLFYGAILSGLGLGDGASVRSLVAKWRAILRDLLPVLIPVMLSLVVVVLFTHSLPHADPPSIVKGGANVVQPTESALHHKLRLGLGMMTEWYSAPGEKIRGAMMLVAAYATWFDGLTLFALIAPLVYCGLKGSISAHRGLLVIGIIFAVCWFLSPFYLTGATWIDRRFSLMAPIVLLAAAHPHLKRRGAMIAMSALAITVIARTAYIGYVWNARAADTRALEAALADVPPGSAILPVMFDPPDHEVRAAAPIGRYFVDREDGTFIHMPLWAVIWRHAFVTTLFAAADKQPIAVRPPWTDIAVLQGNPVSVHALASDDPGDWKPAFAPWRENWRTRFDYVLAINADMSDRWGEFVPPPGLTLIKDEGFAKLWKVQR